MYDLKKLCDVLYEDSIKFYNEYREPPIYCIKLLNLNIVLDFDYETRSKLFIDYIINYTTGVYHLIINKKISFYEWLYQNRHKGIAIEFERWLFLNT
jgi:hypothetical protein